MVKPTDASLNAILNSRQFFTADLYTISLNNGNVLRYCSGPKDITFNGNLYTAGGVPDSTSFGGPYWDRKDNKAKVTWRVGSGNDSLVVDCIPGAATVGGTSTVTVNVTSTQGEALSFDGLTEEIIIPTAFGSTAGGSLSFSAWFKSTVAGGGIINVNNSGSTQSNGANHDEPMYIDTNGFLRGGWYDGSTVEVSALVSTALCNDGNWHHGVFTMAQGSLIALYLDTVQYTHAFGTGETGPNQTFIGNGYGVGYPNFGSTQAYFAGRLSEVRAYNRALSSVDVLNLFNGFNVSSGLVGRYIGSTVASVSGTDLSTAGNNGTVQNSPSIVQDGPSPLTIPVTPIVSWSAGTVDTASGSFSTAMFSTSVPAGVTVVVALGIHTKQTGTSLVDTAGNSYTQAITSNVNHTAEIWYSTGVLAMSSTASFKAVTTAGAAFAVLGAAYMTGAVLDQTASSNATTGNPNLKISGAAKVRAVFTAIDLASSVAYTEDPDSTPITNENNTGGGTFDANVACDISSASTVAYTPTWVGADTYDLVMASFVNSFSTTFVSVTGSMSFFQAIRTGVFDNADFLLQRAFMTTYGTIPSTNCAVTMFQGLVGMINVDRAIATFSIDDYRILFNQQMPKWLFSPTCQNSLYDGNCTVPSSLNASSGTVSAGSSQSFITSTSAGIIANAGQWFDLGKIQFTSGPNSGLIFAVSSYSVPGGVGNIFFTSPLPFAPTTSDTFLAYPGCDRSTGAGGCGKNWVQSTFTGSNITNFRGMPYIPNPGTAL